MIKCLDKGFVRLVDYMGSDDAIVQAARVSYGQGTKTKTEDRNLIRYMLRHGHTSPFEQVEFKFHCKMPIFVARQWVRHRTASLNEYSGRYSEIPEECYIPTLDRFQEQSQTNKQGSSNKQIEATWILDNMKKEQKSTFSNYHSYLQTGLSREISRINLPVSSYTQWYWKMDLHNLFHFLKLRLDKDAQYEIRVYAEAIYELIKPKVPISCEAFEDYILNSQIFSAQEMILLKEFLSKIPNLESCSLQNKGLSKREQKEFVEKIKF